MPAKIMGRVLNMVQSFRALKMLQDQARFSQRQKLWLIPLSGGLGCENFYAVVAEFGQFRKITEGHGERDLFLSSYES